MVQTSINLFDLIVFAVLGLSAILSFFRGFVREVLSLGTWVGAAIITLYAFPHVAALLTPYVKSDTIASGLAGLLTFMGSLILLSILTSILLKFLKPGTEIGMMNNLMGLVFGLLRGALVVAVGFYIFSIAVDEDHYPDWVRGSVSLPYVQDASEWVAKVAPDYLDNITEGKDAEEAVDDAVDKAEEKQERIEDNVKENWPSMDDLKETISGGGY